MKKLKTVAVSLLTAGMLTATMSIGPALAACECEKKQMEYDLPEYKLENADKVKYAIQTQNGLKPIENPAEAGEDLVTMYGFDTTGDKKVDLVYMKYTVPAQTTSCGKTIPKHEEAQVLFDSDSDGYVERIFFDMYDENKNLGADGKVDSMEHALRIKDVFGCVGTMCEGKCKEKESGEEHKDGCGGCEKHCN